MPTTLQSPQTTMRKPAANFTAKEYSSSVSSSSKPSGVEYKVMKSKLEVITSIMMVVPSAMVVPSVMLVSPVMVVPSAMVVPPVTVVPSVMMVPSNVIVASVMSFPSVIAHR